MMDEYIKAKHPKLWDYLVQVKVNTKAIKRGKTRNSNMSVLLMDGETRLMNEIITQLSAPLIYCYDALYSQESEAANTRKIFEGVLKNTFGD